MLKLNPMLLNTINKYLKNKSYFKRLHTLYNSNLELCDKHDFFSQKINTNTLKKGLTFLYNILSLQLILNKKIYFPGVGLFVIEPEDFIPNYSFPETFYEKITINDKIKYRNDNVIENLLTSNGKLNYNILDNNTIQVRQSKDSEKFTFYTKIETKIKYINGRILKESGLKKPQLGIVLIDKYKGRPDFVSIVNDYKKNTENGIDKFLDNIYLDDVLFNINILYDIILLIGYIENNLEEIEKA